MGQNGRLGGKAIAYAPWDGHVGNVNAIDTWRRGLGAWDRLVKLHHTLGKIGIVLVVAAHFGWLGLLDRYGLCCGGRASGAVGRISSDFGIHIH